MVSTLKRCGPTNQLFGIIKHLDRDKYHPVVLTLSPEAGDSRWDDFVALGIEVRTLGLGRLGGMLASHRMLRKQLSAIKPDVVHTQGIRADGLAARVLTGVCPQVATLRNYPFKDYAMSFGVMRGSLMARWHVSRLKRATVVALVSHAIADMLKQDLPGARVVQNGVDLDRYHPVNGDRKRELRAQFGLAANTRLFISSGDLDPRKDPDVLIQGFLKGAAPQDVLLLLGEGSLSEHLHGEYGPVSNVKLLGRVSNVDEYLQAGDYFISASLAEGLPNAVLEALACGLPCLLSDIPEHREITGDSDLESLLFATGDAYALAEAIRGMAAKADDEAGEAAVEIVRRRFSAEHMSGQYQHIYSALQR